MIELPTPSIPELARATGETVDELFGWFLAYYSRESVPWNYLTSIRCVRSAYCGLHNLPLLVAGCEKEALDTGRKSNAEVVDLAAPVAFGRDIQVFPFPKRQFQFGRDRRAGYRIPFFFVEDGIVKLYYLQPRKHAAANFDQLGMVATIHKRFLLDTEFYEQPSDVEYVDLSVGASNIRRLKRYSLSDLTMWSEDRLITRLTMIAEALDRVAASGLIAPRRRPTRSTGDMPLFD